MTLRQPDKLYLTNHLELNLPANSGGDAFGAKESDDILKTLNPTALNILISGRFLTYWQDRRERTGLAGLPEVIGHLLAQPDFRGWIA